MSERWTQEQTSFLIKNYKRLTYHEIGIILNKNALQVQNKKEYLKLTNKQIDKKFIKRGKKYV